MAKIRRAVNGGAAWWPPLLLLLLSLAWPGRAAPGGEAPDDDSEDVPPIAAAGAGAGEGGTGFVVRPWLRFPARTSMTISWISGSSQECVLRLNSAGGAEREARVGSPLAIEFAPNPPAATPGPPPAKAPEPAPPPAAAAPDPPLEKHYLFTARLDGLEPGTEYRYSVDCGGAGAAGSFRTVPEKAEPFTFLAFSDVHCRDGISGGFAAQKPAFLVNCGDLVARERYPEYLRFFSEGMNAAAGRWPMFVARGNHDESAKWLARFFSEPEGRHYYSFDYGDAHFVCLDSLLGRGDKSGRHRAMLEWCDADLAASRARWKVVFHHFPSYDVGKHLSAWGRKDLLPILRKHGVDLTISGHDHSYQRFKPMFTKGENDGRPITHVVAAAGSPGLYRLEREPFLAASDASEPSFLAVTVSRDRLSGRCIGADGRELDAFSIDKRADGSLDPAWLAGAVPEERYGDLREAVRPSLKGLGLPEDPRGGQAMTFKLGIGAPDRPVRFEVRAEKRSQADYEVTPVSGEAPAGGIADVELRVRLLKPELYRNRELKDVPWLRLEVLLESGGQKASIIRYLVHRPPAPQGSGK